MRRAVGALIALALALPAVSVPGPAQASIVPPGSRMVRAAWTPFVTGIVEPVQLTHPDGDARMFVVERPGRIRVVKKGALLPAPFLDVSALVENEGVDGLLSMAFRPDFKTSGLFFVAYMKSDHVLHVARFHAAPAADVADSTSRVTVIDVPYPVTSNHYGGQIAFGPAGFLFIGTGDGSPKDVAGDQANAAQDLGSPLGKILRIDVNHPAGGKQYSVPSNNPYVGRAGAVPEIWLVGFRNPWRFSFDRGLPDLWIGDVGENDREEIDRVPNVGGLNFGWDCREGNLDTSATYGGAYCTGPTFAPPVYVYPHASDNCAVMGGYVYRGTTYSGLVGGKYLYGDYCTGRLWLLGQDSKGRYRVDLVGKFPGLMLGFGRDSTGELYLMSVNAVYHVTFRRR
ncbi:MAG: hypothetical protein QOE45_3164 [Frankiaceae bacterium]|jgi:glucose/arabinose dehydrogenase|nr:hypothetical protein [Frankiaceae bacterium]